VGANLEVMKVDPFRMRLKHPFVFTNLTSREGVDQIINSIIDNGGLTKLPHSSAQVHRIAIWLRGTPFLLILLQLCNVLANVLFPHASEFQQSQLFHQHSGLAKR